MLLYEDGTRAQFLPGEGKEFFSLSKYKEALGKDYRRIVLYLCTERDYEYNNDHLTDASIWTKLDEGASGFSKDVDTEIPNSPDEKRAKVIEIDDEHCGCVSLSFGLECYCCRVQRWFGWNLVTR